MTTHWRYALLGTSLTTGMFAGMLLLLEAAGGSTLQAEIWCQAVAAQTHPPSGIYAVLIALILVSSLLAGHAMARGPRNWVHMVGFAATLALALYVILDLEFPRLGFIRLDAYDQALVDVRESMR